MSTSGRGIRTTNPNQVYKYICELDKYFADHKIVERIKEQADILCTVAPQFANAVTLKGHVAQPLRYPHRPGMRIRDLIPDRDALITPDFYRRKNLLVQVLEPEEDVFDESAARIGVGAGTNANSVNRNDALRIAGTPAGRNAPRIAASTEHAEDRLAAEQARKSPASLAASR